MIKVNLKPGAQSSYAKKGGALSSSGLDLSSSLSIDAFNPVIWIACAFLIFAPRFWFKGDWEKEQSVLQERISVKQRKLRSLNVEMKKLREFKETRDQLMKEEQRMQKALQVVSKVLDRHNNPMGVMNYIAENIPKDIWLKDLNIIDNQMDITGYALNFKSIDVFKANLNESLFFEQSAKLQNYNTKEMKDLDRRVEEFRIKAKVARFE